MDGNLVMFTLAGTDRKLFGPKAKKVKLSPTWSDGSAPVSLTYLILGRKSIKVNPFVH